MIPIKSKGRVTLAGAVAVWLMCSLVFVARPITAHAAVGDVTTIAGGNCCFGGDGGPATSAQMQYPIGLARDATGNLYIGDYGNNRIRKVDTSGIITTFAGNGTAGYTGDGGPATSAELNGPSWLALDSSGNLLICDTANNVIREITMASGTITTVAGNGTAGYTGDSGPATSAELNSPSDVTALPGGGFLVADYNNNVVRKVNSSGTITTFAGNGTAGFAGDGGAATAAELNGPQSEAVDAAGDVYIADFSNYRIREVNTGGIISTVVGNGTSGYSGDGGPATSAQLNTPVGMTFKGKALYFTDYNNNAVREVDATGTITTLAAGNLFHPQGVLFDPSGNLIISDTLDERVQQVAGIGNDLISLSGSAPASVPSSQTYAYTMTIRQPGTVATAATGVNLSDTLPSAVSFVSATSTQGTCTPSGGTVSCAIGTVAAGATVTVTINVTAPSASSSLSNSASVTASPADPDTVDDTVTQTTLVDVADLSLTATSSPGTVVFGNPVTFTVAVQNAGTSDATNVKLTNAFTAGVPIQSTSASQGSCSAAAPNVNCSLGTLANGASATVTIVVVPPQSVTSVADNASVSADQIDPNTSNNSASASSGVALTTFQEVPVGRTSPQGLAFGPDGNIWISDTFFSRQVMQMTTTGATTTFPTTARDVQFITRGPDGNMWFTESSQFGMTTFTEQSYIGRLSTSGQLKEFPLPTKFSSPYAIAAGADGNLWFTEDASKIGRITPQGVVTEYPIPTQQALVDAIALGPDGNMWFTESRTDKLARVNPQGQITEFDLPSGAGPEGLVTGPDHNLWIVESGSNNIARFNVGTHALTEYPIPTQNSEAEYIAVGPDGNLYFTEADFFNYQNQEQAIIGRISTSGSMLEIPIPGTSRDEPWDIVAGPDGNMWFTEQFSGEIVSMVPPTNVAGTQEKGTSSMVRVSAHQPAPIAEVSLPETYDVGPLFSARGSDGNLYTVEQFKNALAKVGPGGAVSEITAPAGSVGTLATGSDGNVWYCDNNNGLNRLNTTTNVVTNFPTPSSGDCHDLVASADGSLWWDNPGAGNIGKMTTSGVATEFPINASLLSGPGGTVWIQAGPGFERLNPDGTVAAAYTLPPQAATLGGVSQCTGGADGNLWCEGYTYDSNTGVFPDVVVRVNVTSGAVDLFKTGIRGGTLTGITEAPDGNVWVAFGGNGNGPTGMFAMNTSGQIVFKQLVPAGFATPFGGISVGPALNGSKNGWAVYMKESAINSFAVVPGVNG